MSDKKTEWFDQYIKSLDSNDPFQEIGISVLSAISDGLKKLKKPITYDAIYEAMLDLDEFKKQVDFNSDCKEPDSVLKKIANYDDYYLIKTTASFLPSINSAWDKALL